MANNYGAKMSLILRKARNGKHCHICGHKIAKDEYGGEVGIVLTIYLCSSCAYINKDKIHALPLSLELTRKALASPLIMLDNKQGGLT